jgi:hypothetical protein
VNTMPIHFTNHIANGVHSAGLILIPQLLGIGEAIDVLLLVWQASDSSEWVDRIEFLPWS